MPHSPASPVDTVVQDEKFESRLDFLARSDTGRQLASIGRGIEKEGLRSTPEGKLALTPHPRALGSALTNSWLTTDFSESLLEFITPVRNSVESTLQYLACTHSVAAQNIGDEIIWAASMPCELPEDPSIPLAHYGSSNIATMKTAYRRGLGHRYGRAMQTVAGIHYNFSLPEQYWPLEMAAGEPASGTTPGVNAAVDEESLRRYTDTRYLDLLRNFRRDYWLLIYLFGTAPCVDRSFLTGREHALHKLGERDLYLPNATSLRMGDLGYQSAVQKQLFVCYNELNTYIATLRGAIKTPYPPYEKIGTKVDGEYQQLSSGILQIANEFYSPIRPKRTIQPGEMPLHALRDRGIQYVEVRCMDIDPYQPLGIADSTIRFLDAFLLYCLAYPSTPCDEAEFRQIADNQSRVVNQGRDPDLKLGFGNQQIFLRDRADTLLSCIEKTARVLDQSQQNNNEPPAQHIDAVKLQRAKLENTAQLPSARFLRDLQDSGQSYVQLMSARSAQFMKEHNKPCVSDELRDELVRIAQASPEKQAAIERADTLSFDDYIADYFAK